MSTQYGKNKTKDRRIEGVREQRMEKSAPERPGLLCCKGSHLLPLNRAWSLEDKRRFLQMWDNIGATQSSCPFPFKYLWR